MNFQQLNMQEYMRSMKKEKVCNCRHDKKAHRYEHCSKVYYMSKCRFCNCQGYVESPKPNYILDKEQKTII